MKIVRAVDGEYLVGTSSFAFVPDTAWSTDGDHSRLLDAYKARLDITVRHEPAYHVTVLTSTDCNLACPYCFQNVGPESDGHISPRIPASHLSGDVVGSISGFLRRQVQRYGLAGVHLLLFGGEPLLRYTDCLALLDSVRDIPLISAALQSNGTLLTRPRAQELSSRGVRNFHVTLDGNRANHNSLRYFRNRRGSYDVILDNLRKCSAAVDADWQIRINVDLRSVASLTDTVSDLAGCLPPHRSKIYLAPLFDYGQGVSEPIIDPSHVLCDLKTVYTAILKEGFKPLLPTPRVECSYCTVEGGGAGAVIGPDGSLYSCWDVAGRSDFIVGNVIDGYDADQGIIHSKWKHCGDSAIGVDAARLFQEIDDGMELFWLESVRGLAQPGRREEVERT